MNATYVTMYTTKEREGFRPQQGLTIMNPLGKVKANANKVYQEFPSPTGVNYYESVRGILTHVPLLSFRPQQGLTIMNL